MFSINTYSGRSPQESENKSKHETPVRRVRYNLRRRELEQLFISRYGDLCLPDDEAGYGDLRLMADLLLLRGEYQFLDWARRWTPWASDACLDEVIRLAGRGKWWSDQALADELRVGWRTRLQFDFRTIRACDRTWAQLQKDKRERKAGREATSRLTKGATPRAMSEAQLKPWLEENVSESTYRRKKRKNKTAAGVTVIRAPHSYSRNEARNAVTPG